jgi:hypothetical protein
MSPIQNAPTQNHDVLPALKQQHHCLQSLG